MSHCRSASCFLSSSRNRPSVVMRMISPSVMPLSPGRTTATGLGNESVNRYAPRITTLSRSSVLYGRGSTLVGAVDSLSAYDPGRLPWYDDDGLPPAARGRDGGESYGRYAFSVAVPA